jgi:queuine tRNA-ribosyltransferase
MLPADKPRYLMGVGFPRDIVTAVAAGIDMFDCVLPTRNGRNAYAFTAGGAIRLRNSRFARDRGPIEDGCDCYACKTFTARGDPALFFRRRDAWPGAGESA